MKASIKKIFLFLWVYEGMSKYIWSSKNLQMNIKIYLDWRNGTNTNTDNIWGWFYWIFEYLNICVHHCSRHCQSQSVRTGVLLTFWEKVHPSPCVTCHVSHVSCQISHVMCHMSSVTIFITFFKVVMRVGRGSVINWGYSVYFSVLSQI